VDKRNARTDRTLSLLLSPGHKHLKRGTRNSD
jgi:hypothetical protein